jgi:hypothetical protein
LESPILTAKKSPSSIPNALTLEGVIDETTDFQKLIGNPKAELRLNCREIRRINSGGIRNWTKYFTALLSGGVKVTLEECSPQVVEFLNQVTESTNRGISIESVHVPYFCEACDKEVLSLHSVEQLKQAGCQVSDTKCPTCGGSASFDDISAQFFRFMSR